MEKQVNKPKLRFPEFEGEWESKKLEKITNYVDYRGRAPLKTEDGIFLITAKNIKKGYIDYECSKEYVAVDNYLTVMSKGLPKIGDVLFTTEAPMGNVAMVDNENIALAQRVIKFRGNHLVNNTYLLHYMLSNAFQKIISQKSFGTTVQGISGKELHQILISFPTHPEQTKIASFLTAVDDKLQALKKKKTLLEQYKKGVMQKIFSQELRFKDYNKNEYPDWEEKKLGDIGEIVTGKTPSTANLDLWDGEILFVTPTDIKQSKYQISTERTIKKTEKLKILPCNSIMFTCIASIGKMSISIYPSVTNQQINTIIPNESYYHEFIYYGLLNITDFIKSTPSSSTLPLINKTEFSRFIIQIPCIEEQTKIANFLSAIDDKINHCEAQIEKTEVWKKGLLQQMFC